MNLKLYKMKRHELKDYQKTIQDVLARSEDEQPAASEQQGQISPTPSPAGSEGSNCSKVTLLLNFFNEFLSRNVLGLSEEILTLIPCSSHLMYISVQ